MSRAIALGGLAISAGLAAWTFVLIALGAGGSSAISPVTLVGFTLGFLAYAVVGALIAPRYPRLSIGWMFVAIGLGMTADMFAHAYASYVLTVQRAEVDPVFPWIAMWLWVPAIVLASVVLPLTFPDGRLPSPHWRWVIWTAVAVVILDGLAWRALRPGALDFPFADVANPFGLSGLAGELVLRYSGTAGLVAWCVALLGAIGAVVARFRAAGTIERLQLKWLAYAAGMQAVIVVPSLTIAQVLGQQAAFQVTDLAWSVWSALMPIAAGIAILRYRLYDIDLVINRTLVYAALTAGLGLTYWGGVVLLQQVLRPFTQGSELAIIGSTLLVAALFQPARSRVQNVVDRRFYRRKYDAQRTLEGFSARLRQEVELKSLSGELLAVVHQTIQPAHAALWLRGGAAAPPSPAPRD